MVVLRPLRAWSLLVVIFLGLTSQVRSQGTLTTQERELVSQLRPMVKDIIYKDYMNEDEYLARFLRAHRFNLERTKEKIAEAMKWRKENKMDSILTEDFSEIDNEHPVIFEGTDNDGRPIFIASISVLNLRKITLSGQTSKYLRFFDSVFELSEAVLREMKSAGGGGALHRNASRAYAIIDVNGFNLRQQACLQCIPILLRYLHIYENYYPDLLYRLAVVNIPSTFIPITDLIRPILSPPTRTAGKLFDHNGDKWKAFIRNEVPEAQLPTAYGGSRGSVLPKTLRQLRESNPFVAAAYKKAFAEQKEQNKLP